MRILPLAGLFAAFLFFGIVGTSYATDSLADHVVINEVDTNPPGDDSKTVSEWAELFNPTAQDVDIGGWKIASTTVTKKTMTLPAGTIIKPGQFLVYSYQSLWFTDVGEKVQLKDKDGNLIDETQTITDQKNDFQSWQRKYDGVVSDSNTWVFRGSSAGSSNGKLNLGASGSSEVTVSVKSDSKSYIFDETAIISGNVSKRVYQEKPSFSQQQLSIAVSGPGKFQRTITLYPDLNLQYQTPIKLNKVLGASAGTYKVLVTYGDASDATVFSVGEKKTEAVVETESELSISTDKSTYIPGQTVMISATTSTILPSTGLKYAVYDPKGAQIFSGTLYPTPSGDFSGNVYMSPTKPVYGTLHLVADYGKQHADVMFDLAQDSKDTEKIVLTTDKKAYAPGEPIIISGRSNKYVAALDLDVIQTGTGAIGKGTANNIFKVKDQVKLAGDSTFRYELNVPAGDNNMGDFKVTVSKEFGKATTEFKILQNPDDYVESGKYSIKTNTDKYIPGDTVNVSGHVTLTERSTFEAVPVYISLLDDQGKQITIATQVSNKQLVNDKVSGKTTTYSFTAIPDPAGNFKLDFKIDASTFKPGVYTIRGSYDKHLFDAKFAANSALDVTNRNIIATTDKQVYGLGETVKLEGTLVSGQSAVKIILTKPDGKTTNEGAKLDNSKFTWSWTAPLKEFDLGNIRDPRQDRPTVFGIYKISIIATSQSTDLFFKLSANPALDTLDVKPITVSTDKASYRAGEKLIVSGNVIKRQENVNTSVGTIQDRVAVEIRTLSNKALFTSNLDLDHGGGFKSSYDLPITIFKDGKYKVIATYQKVRAEATFEIKNNIPLGNEGKTVLTIDTDKKEYLPGDTVHVTGSTNKVLYLSTLEVVVNLKKNDGIDCGKFYCGLGGKQVDISRSYSNGFYSYDYVIPANSALGTYVISADTDFGTFTNTFDVVEKLAKKTSSSADKISEKFNRLPDSTVNVDLLEQTKDDKAVAPSILQGSLVTGRGSEKTVNLTITADDGTCVIGQAESCLISGPTKQGNTAYQTVTFAGLHYKVTYSGPDTFLEKFSITPELDEDVIPDSEWVIDIDNHTPATKLYYEIVYKEIQ